MTKLKEVARVDRPREKMLAYGPSKLATSELIAILLGTGTKGANAIEVGKDMLRKFGVLGLGKATIEELSSINGIGKIKALEIMAALELGRRVLQQKKSNLLLSPQEVWEELKELRDLKKEHCVVFFLDSIHQIIKRELVSVGVLNASLVHPREIFEPAIRQAAAEIIVAHNHPSGDKNPSASDVEITRRLSAAGSILGINLIDHVIVVKDGWFSFSESKLLT